jgi:hypothetical protein
MSNRRTKVEFEHFLQIKGFCKTAIGIVGSCELRSRSLWKPWLESLMGQFGQG